MAVNNTLLCDYYELTMANGYFLSGAKDTVSYFDVFFRNVPDGGGFAIAAGLEQIIEYIQNLTFTEEDITYLRSKGVFDEGFLNYLRTFRFTGDLYSVPEGTPVFPNEPILTVRAPAMEAQFMETFLLLTLNHQSLIATKANRVVRAAKGRPISEFGSRRAHGPDAAVFGARAAYIGGCAGTACTISDRLFGVPAGGTMAHSWVQMFGSEYEAFITYCKVYPKNPCLLVDTYNVLRSGVPNAIRVFKEMFGDDTDGTGCSIRIDSGDLTYLSSTARQMLDGAGLTGCKIVASNALDEYIIRDLLLQGAKIDSFGVGERLITSRSTPVFGAVYKLCAVEKNGVVIPRIKISENPQKITTPHFKKVYRIYEHSKAIADYICIHDEEPDFTKPLDLFDPDYIWKRKLLTDYTAEELLIPIFKGGELVYECPPLKDVRDYCAAQVDRQWDEVKRFENPHNYYVDLSQKLWQVKQDLLAVGAGAVI